MRKILALSLACVSSIVSAQNLVQIKDPKIQFPAEAYKTVKNTQIGYSIQFYNYFESSDDQDSNSPNKHGLYTYGNIDLEKYRPSEFPKTYPSIDDVKLMKQLKLSDSEVVAKFKGIGKKQKYFCELTGKMNAQFEVHYEGGDLFRFPSSQVWAKIYSATPVGKPTIKCEKVNF